jgi:hypothetical protein
MKETNKAAVAAVFCLFLLGALGYTVRCHPSLAAYSHLAPHQGRCR